MALDPVVNGVTKFNAAHMNARLQALWTQLTNIGNGVVALLAPAISSFTNAQHNHSNTANGGKITLAAIDGSAYDEGEYTVDVDASGNVTLQTPSASQGFPVGYIIDWSLTLAKLEARTGGSWLGCDGKTIGNAASGGTARANADCQTLFEDLWELANTYGTLTLQDSSGSPVLIGVNAAADWAAARRIPLPDERGRTHIGRDNQGGSSANRVTASAADNVLGNSGAETHTLIIAEMPAHTHSISTLGNTYAAGAGGTNTVINTGTKNTNSTGGDGAHNNMQPYLVVDRYIRYK